VSAQRAVEISSLRIGQDCVLPDGRGATVDARGKRAVVVVADGVRLGVVLNLPNDTLVRPTGTRSPNYSPGMSRQ